MMKLLHGFLALGFLLFAAASPRVAADEPKSGNKIRVVIIDGQNNHDWRATTPLLKQYLGSSSLFSVDVSTNVKANEKVPEGHATVAFPPDLSKFDVLLSNYNGQPWPADFQSGLEDAVKSGRLAMVIVHAANNAFDKWPEYNLMIGMGWRGSAFGDRLVTDDSGKPVRVEKGKGPSAGHGPRHPFQVTIRDADHPVTRGMPRLWLHAKDELYHGMRGPIANVHLLATAFSDKKEGGTGEHEPMIWTVSYGKGRVFHTPMGHDVEAMRCVGFVTTLLRGTEWTATGNVSQPLPGNLPSADKVSTVESK